MKQNSQILASPKNRAVHANAGYEDPWPANYVEVNRTAYDALAKEYQARQDSDRAKDLKLIRPFVRLLRRQFNDESIHVLDLGCGNGLNLAMFSDEGFRCTGIDISPSMLEIAHQSCRRAELINGNFLTFPFSGQFFHGVFAKAIIHLFPKQDALRVLAKIHSILHPHGICYVTTTVESGHIEGLRKKDDYSGKVRRYRATWEAAELSTALSSCGFGILESSYNTEPNRNKKWFNIWAIRL